MDAVLKLLAVMTGDNRFEDVLNLADGEERPKTMSEWIDRALERGWNKGWNEGQRDGLRNGKRETAFNLRKMKMTDDFIAQAVGESVGVVRQWLSSPNSAD
ncbi:MAG: hypothetical protein IJU98_10730 [Synergistaceae bacterium]|nr:hypothetical protein [Synergistaceae bacterium]